MPNTDLEKMLKELSFEELCMLQSYIFREMMEKVVREKNIRKKIEKAINE